MPPSQLAALSMSKFAHSPLNWIRQFLSEGGWQDVMPNMGSETRSSWRGMKERRR